MIFIKKDGTIFWNVGCLCATVVPCSSSDARILWDPTVSKLAGIDPYKEHLDAILQSELRRRDGEQSCG